jgi:hypothetical protein
LVDRSDLAGERGASRRHGPAVERPAAQGGLVLSRADDRWRDAAERDANILHSTTS